MSKIKECLDNLYNALEAEKVLPEEKDAVFMVSNIDGEVCGLAAGDERTITALLADAIMRDKFFAKLFYEALILADVVKPNSNVKS